MTRKTTNGGMLICGVCAIPAASNEPASTELIGNAIKKLFSRKRARTNMMVEESKAQ